MAIAARSGGPAAHEQYVVGRSRAFTHHRNSSSTSVLPRRHPDLQVYAAVVELYTRETSQ